MLMVYGHLLSGHQQRSTWVRFPCIYIIKSFSFVWRLQLVWIKIEYKNQCDLFDMDTT